MAEIKFEIRGTVGVLSESSKGWKKELNLISWNDRDPKYDIRDWAPEHGKMGKGVTLTIINWRRPFYYHWCKGTGVKADRRRICIDHI